MNANYGIVRLATNKKEYIPTADKFKDEVIEEKIINKKKIEFNNSYFNNDDDNKTYKPYQAFIFSIKSNKTVQNFAIKYKIIKTKKEEKKEKEEKEEKKEKKYRILTFVSNGISFIIAVIFFIFIFKLNKKGFYSKNLEFYESLY